MRNRFLLLCPLSLAATVLARVPSHNLEPCMLPRGDWIINQLGLYLENLDIDPKRCIAWIGALWNCTVTKYDIRQEKVIGFLDIPGVSGPRLAHTSGIQVDTQHDRMVIVNEPGKAFATLGQDLSGDTIVSLYDLKTGKFNWIANVTYLLAGQYGGFQDADTDSDGNVFVVGGYPSSLIRITVDGKSATMWYSDPNKDHRRYGFTGIAALEKGEKLIVSDNITGGLWTFNLYDTYGKPTPVYLEGNKPLSAGTWDGIILPTMFKQTVLLVSDDDKGTWVIRSKDGWRNAESLGIIPRQFAEDGGVPTATVEIGDRIFVSTAYLDDTVYNRTKFPFYDIKDDIFKMLGSDYRI